MNGAHEIDYRPTGEWASHPDRHCRGLDPNIFIVERGDHKSLEAVRAICDGCPVKTECAEFAIDDASVIGVWGGLSAKERRNIRRQRAAINGPRRPGPKPGGWASCGTNSGYNRHRREGTVICQQCRLAHNAYYAEAKRRRRAEGKGRAA